MAFSARREAGIRSITGLTPHQRAAADHVYALLVELASQKWADPTQQEAPPPFLPRLVRERFNQTILIDGARGSGKTTVMLTLLDAFSSLWDHRRKSALEKGAASVDFDPVVPAGEAPGNGAPSVLVPLEIVELHPLPDSANLFLHIAGRFERVMRAMDRSEPAPAWHPDGGSRGPRSPGRWRALVDAIATGWDSNVRDRRGRLDPEAYALELEESAGKGLLVHRAFQEFLDALTLDFRATYGRVGTVVPALPLFVVPIDDADMNPHRATELIDLLRTLWHPRVAFVLTGHSDMFLTALRAHYLAVLRRPLARLRASDEELHHLGERSGPARLAEEVYSRVVPRSHRCRLRPLPPSERLAAGGDDREITSRLRGALQDIRVGAADSPRGLDAYFDANPQLLEALPDRLRSLLDLAVAVERKLDFEAARGEDRPALARVMPNFLWDVLARANLSPDSDHHVQGVLNLDGKRLAVAASSLQWEPVRHDMWSVDRYPFRVVVGRPTRVDAGVQGPPERPFSRLPPVITATVMLATDIASDDPTAFFVGASPAPPTFRWVFARSEFTSEVLGASMTFSWSLPKWTSFRDYFQFSRHWLSYCSAHPRVPVDQAARMFVHLAFLVQQDSFGTGLSLPEHPPSWAEILAGEGANGGVYPLLRRALESAAPSQRDLVFSEWILQRLPLLSAPEMGLDAAGANALFTEVQRVLGDDPRFKEAHELRSRHRMAALRSAVAWEEVDFPAGKRPERVNIEARVEDLRAELYDRTFHFCEAYEPDGSASAPAEIDHRAPAGLLRDRALFEAFQTLRVRVEAEKGTFLDGRWVTVGDYLFGPRANVLQIEELFRHGTAVHAALVRLGDIAHEPVHVVLPAIWEAIAPPDRRSVVSNRTNRLVVRDLVARADRDAPSCDNRGLDGMTYDIGGAGLAVALEGAGPHVEAFYRLAWDVAADELDLMPEGQHAVALTRYWDPVAVRVSGASFAIPWIVPSFDALLDWELLQESWNSVITPGKGAFGEDESRNTQVMDRLARWLMEAVVHVAYDRMRYRRGEESDFEVTPDEAMFRAVVRDKVCRVGSRERDGRLKGRRFQAFKAWRDAVPLFAAPESGLSRATASVLLDESGLLLPNPPRDRIVALRAARFERALHAAGPGGDEAARRLLDAADALAGPTHPWIHHIGAHKD